MNSSMENKSIVEYVAGYAVTRPHVAAVIDNERRISYAELFETAKRGCCFLRKAGMKRGDILVVKASQDIKHAIIYLSAHLAGCVFTPLERSTPNPSLASIAEQIGAKAVISDDTELKKMLERCCYQP